MIRTRDISAFNVSKYTQGVRTTHHATIYTIFRQHCATVTTLPKYLAPLVSLHTGFRRVLYTSNSFQQVNNADEDPSPSTSPRAETSRGQSGSCVMWSSPLENGARLRVSD
jgi:hypothetical protein